MQLLLVSLGDDYVQKVVPVSRQLCVPAGDLILLQQISGKVDRFFIAQTPRSPRRHGIADGTNYKSCRPDHFSDSDSPF